MPIQAPQWTDYLNCPVCCREFGPPPRSPVSLGCGHTLCRHCLKHLHRKQCPFDQTVIQLDLEDLVTNTAVLQLAGYAPPSQPYHPPCIQALSEQDRHSYDVIVRCMENLAVYLKFCGTATNGIATNRLSRPMQRKLITVIQCAMTDEEGRGRAARAARSLGERTVTELILQHQNPQHLSANLWAAVRARGCQFLGPAMQEEVLKLVLLALEDGSALSRKVLVMFVVQRLEPHFPQASKTSIGHVVQLLYRASCFKVSKRESDSSLMQLKEEFRSYESLRREHDAQIVQIATEAGLRIAPDQWSSLLYGDTVHKSHMQSIIDKLQTPASFGQSVQELFIALQRSGDPAQLVVLSIHLDRLASIEPAPDAKCPPWHQLAEIMSSLNEVVARLIHYLQQQAAARDVNHNAKHLQVNMDNKQASPGTGGSTPTHGRYKVSMCRDAAQRSFCPRGSACTFAHTEEELERFRSLPSPSAVVVNGNYNYLVPTMPPPALFTRFPMPGHHAMPDNYNMPPLPQMPAPAVMPPPEMIQNQEYDNARAPDNIQPQNFPAPLMHNPPPVPPPPLKISQNGAAAAPDRYYPRYPPQYDAPTISTFNPAVDSIQAPLPPGIVVNYAPKEAEGASYAFEDHGGEPRQELLHYRINSFPAQPPLDRRPGTLWSPINNNMFKFDGMVNALPLQNANEDMFNVASERRAVGADRLPTVADRLAAADLNNMADDQELEEELQALERRIDTEFKSTD